MGYSTQIGWENLRKIDELTGGWDNVGSPLANPSIVLKMVNTSTTTVEVSINGSTAIDVCPAGGFWLYDEGKFAVPGQCSVPSHTQISVKGTAGELEDGNGDPAAIYLVTQYLAVK